MMRSMWAGVVAISVACFAMSAQAQPTPRGGPVITAHAPDLIPIPSRITHGVVSVRNAGTAASVATVVTVNCHKPNQQGGCPEIPAPYAAAYTDPDFPNRLTVQVPALAPGHVHNHSLSFWGHVAFPSGSYVFEYVADAAGETPAGLNAESNEGNNAASFVWVKP